MPVIQTFDPATAASDAIGAYSETKRRNALDAAAQAAQNRQEAYQQKRDSRRDMESDRSFGLQQGEAADRHAMTSSEIATADQQRRIASATEAYNEQLRPITLQQEQIHTRVMRGELSQQAAAAKLVGLQTQAARVDLEIKTKYGVKEAAAGLAKSQADASTATTEAKFAPQQAQAQIDQAHASIASTNAQTALTSRETSLAGTSGGFGRGRGAGGSATERATAAYDSAMEALSDTGRQFYDMLYSTNNPPTRAQAMLALQASARHGSGLSKADTTNLETLINSRESQFETPAAQAGERRYEERTQASDGRHQQADRETAFRDVARGKSYNALAPRLREMVRHVLVDQGMSVEQALQQLPGAPIDDASKQAITRALSGG